MARSTSPSAPRFVEATLAPVVADEAARPLGIEAHDRQLACVRAARARDLLAADLETLELVGADKATSRRRVRTRLVECEECAADRPHEMRLRGPHRLDAT